MKKHKKWEYHCAWLTRGTRINDLKELGAEGWELVSCFEPRGFDDIATFFFKRELHE